MQSEPFKADPPKHKRRWFQFSLRTLLIFTAIAAVSCGWLGKKIERKHQEQAAVNAIRKSGGSVDYDYESLKSSKPSKPPGPDWLRKLIGENFFSEVEGVFTSKATDADLERLEVLPQLKSLMLGGNQSYTDAGLMNLRRLPQLQALKLGTEVTDAGLIHLSGLSELNWLDLEGTQVTDAGLVNLKGLIQLKTLSVLRTNVTDAGVKDLQTALPDCKIYHGSD